MTKIEEVARAIAESQGIDGDDWLAWQDMARAAIEAMREPTPAMLNGARDWSIKRFGRGIGNDAASACLGAMIDAALKETP